MAAPLGRDFHRFWAAAAVSNLGDGIRFVALPLLALRLTDDARLVALVSASILLPWLVFGPIGGALADRVDRRRLMLTGHLGRAVAVGGLAVAVALDQASIPMLVAAAIVLGIGELLADSSAHAAVPQLVEDHQLERANGRLIATVTVCDQLVGPMVGAAVFVVAASGPFAIDAVSFLLAAILLSTVRRPLQGPRSGPSEPFRDALVGGFRFVAGNPLLRGLAIVTPMNNFGINVSFGVLVILIRTELDASEQAFGVILALAAGGGVLGSMAAPRLVDRFGRTKVMMVAPVTFVAAYLILAAAPSPWIAAAGLLVAHLGIVGFNIPARSLRQSITPDDVLGRVTAVFQTVGYSAGMAGALLGGLITEATSAKTANLTAAGIGLVAWALLALTVARHLDAAAPTEPAAVDLRSGSPRPAKGSLEESGVAEATT
ncbi:MAG: MFS transporter [Acidimicrobiales bacterium]